MSNENFPVKRVISNIEEMQTLICELQVNSPRPIRQALNSQMQIIQSIQSPTLNDTLLTTMISDLDISLEDCENEKQKKSIQRQFSMMVQNFIFFLDAKIQLLLQNNDELSRELFVKAGDMLSKNMRDLLLMMTETFGAVVKVTATGVDVIGTNAVILGNGLASETLIASKTGVSTTSNGESTTVDQKEINPENSQVIKDIATDTADKINDNLGELDGRISEHTDNWINGMNNIIINNMFSQERMEDRKNFLGNLYDWLKKDKNFKKRESDFYETINSTIIKLKKYRQMIGKSIIISEMIERYLKPLQKHLENKKHEEGIGGFIDKIPFSSVLDKGKIIIFGKTEYEDINHIISDYRAVADSYNKMSDYISKSYNALSDNEKQYYNEFKLYSENEISIDQIKRKLFVYMAKEHGITEQRAREIENI